MNISTFKSNAKVSVPLIALALLFIPVFSQAATSPALSYQPQTEKEKIAYLYGRISQLLEMQEVIRNGGKISDIGQTVFDYTTIKTYKATEVKDVTAVLRGEVVLLSASPVTAWFEYGQDSDFLDQRTGKVTVRDAYERAVRIQVRNLVEDKRYYYRIATQSKDGSVKYGYVFGFRTDESTR